MQNMEEGRRPAGILIRKKDVKPAKMNYILSLYLFKKRDGEKIIRIFARCHETGTTKNNRPNKMEKNC